MARSYNWKNREERINCGTCLFFERSGGPAGSCHAKSPTGVPAFPLVDETDWCGEHFMNEEALTT